MSEHIPEAEWARYRVDVMQRWGELTDEDLNDVNGSWAKLLETLKQKLGISHEDAEAQLMEHYTQSRNIKD